jgi:hypothetical protein
MIPKILFPTSMLANYKANIDGIPTGRKDLSDCFLSL